MVLFSILLASSTTVSVIDTTRFWQKWHQVLILPSRDGPMKMDDRLVMTARRLALNILVEILTESWKLLQESSIYVLFGIFVAGLSARFCQAGGGEPSSRQGKGKLCA